MHRRCDQHGKMRFAWIEMEGKKRPAKAKSAPSPTHGKLGPFEACSSRDPRVGVLNQNVRIRGRLLLLL